MNDRRSNHLTFVFFNQNEIGMTERGGSQLHTDTYIQEDIQINIFLFLELNSKKIFTNLFLKASMLYLSRFE